MNILVFAPHPDDDAIGMGGQIAKHVAEGNPVWVVYVCTGDKGSPKITPDKLVKIRKKEAISGAAILGVKKGNLIFLENKDGEINPTETAKEAEKIIDEIKPEIIYIPHNKDNLADHLTVNKVVRKIIKKKTSKPKLYGYEVWTAIQNPAKRVDITPFINQKISAIREHKSQLEIVPYDVAAKALASYRGIMVPRHKTKYKEFFTRIYN